jgi:uncharacterized membrane protein
MDKGRFEEFSDGVIAVIITIMVLEIRAPHAPTLAALCEWWPVFLSYLLSFRAMGRDAKRKIFDRVVRAGDSAGIPQFVDRLRVLRGGSNDLVRA